MTVLDSPEVNIPSREAFDDYLSEFGLSAYREHVENFTLIPSQQYELFGQIQDLFHQYDLDPNEATMGKINQSRHRFFASTLGRVLDIAIEASVFGHDNRTEELLPEANRLAEIWFKRKYSRSSKELERSPRYPGDILCYEYILPKLEAFQADTTFVDSTKESVSGATVINLENFRLKRSHGPIVRESTFTPLKGERAIDIAASGVSPGAYTDTELIKLRNEAAELGGKPFEDLKELDYRFRKLINIMQETRAVGISQADSAQFALTVSSETFAQIQKLADDFVRNIINQSLNAHPSEELFDELKIIANWALLKASLRFDPEYENPFWAFAKIYIDGEIKRHFRDTKIQSSILRRAEFEKAIKINQKLDEGMDIDEVAAELGMSPQDVRDALSLVENNNRLTSLDAEPNDGHRVRDYIESTLLTPEEQIVDSLVDENLQNALLKLSPTKKELVVLRERFGIIRRKDGIYVNSPVPDRRSQSYVSGLINQSQVEASRVERNMVSRLQDILGVHVDAELAN